jgi:hypothetical protein
MSEKDSQINSNYGLSKPDEECEFDSDEECGFNCICGLNHIFIRNIDNKKHKSEFEKIPIPMLKMMMNRCDASTLFSLRLTCGVLYDISELFLEECIDCHNKRIVSFCDDDDYICIV